MFSIVIISGVKGSGVSDSTGSVVPLYSTASVVVSEGVCKRSVLGFGMIVLAGRMADPNRIVVGIQHRKNIPLIRYMESFLLGLLFVINPSISLKFDNLYP